jgi:hypothetical protein
MPDSRQSAAIISKEKRGSNLYFSDFIHARLNKFGLKQKIEKLKV